MTVNVALSVKATRVGEHTLYDSVLVLCYALLLPVATAGTFYIKCRRVAKAGDDEDDDEHNDAADATLLVRATKMYINGTATERHRAILLEFLRHKADEAAMQRQRWKLEEKQAGGRAGSNLNFEGNRVFSQKFFIASFPGIYVRTWKKMTEGVHAFLLSVACVFFQDINGGINGRHTEEATQEGAAQCKCELLAKCAPDQARPQTGELAMDLQGNAMKNENGEQQFTMTDEQGNVIRDDDGNPKHILERDAWSGCKPPWGCLWALMWEYNVLALRDCSQQAVGVYQTAPDTMTNEEHPQWGTHTGLGNAQLGEVEFLHGSDIPIYGYFVSEYEELVELAQQCKPVPKTRLVLPHSSPDCQRAAHRVEDCWLCRQRASANSRSVRPKTAFVCATRSLEAHTP